MKKQDEKIKYGEYLRKSSEDEDRQINSIEDQQRELDAIALKEKLNIVIKYPGESQSAHHPGRSIFADAIKDIELGKINALFVWHANRLSRNPIDTGMIIYLMDIGKLKEVKTTTRTYYNTSSDKHYLSQELSNSKKDSDDKSEVVKRALEGRAIRGLPSGVSKVGFLNDMTEEKGNRKWIVDKIRFPLVKQLLERMLTGRYSPAQIYRYAKDDLKLTTTPRKREGGKPVAFSYVYTLLRDPIFAGFFSHNGKRYELDKRLPRAITEEEYWKIQAMLGSKGRPQPSKHEGLYNHFLSCGECKGRMSPDFKFQLICPVCKLKFSCINMDKCPKCKTKTNTMTDPTYCSYVYYYCINNKKHRSVCPSSTIEQKRIETAVYDKFTNEICISKELSDWCLKNLSIIKDTEIQDESAIKTSLDEQEIQVKKKLNNLLSYRIKKQDITSEQEEIFEAQEKELQQEWSDIKQRKNVKIDWYSEAAKEFNLMTEIEDTLKNGTPAEKKELFYELRSNLTVSEKNLIVINRKSINAFAECILRAKSENRAFEPRNNFPSFTNKSSKEKTEVFASVIPTLLRG
ncbi:MAG: recombinase family protein [Candidatus Paceibacterota bacterium]